MALTYLARKQGYIDLYLAGGLPLFHNGNQNRGSSSRCAFWDGYNGLPNTHFPGIGKAAHAAGKHCAKNHPLPPTGETS